MNVGDYVRFKDKRGNTYIRQIKDLPQDIRYGAIKIDIEANYSDMLSPKNVIKSSSNIIDLIEVGDIVKIEYQGWHQVSIKFETLKFFDDEGIEYLYDEIKAIITREQVESIKYKVGEK